MWEITKTFNFEASHQLWDKTLSDHDNRMVFGKCANKPSHGHSYRVEVTLKSNKLKYGMLRNFSEVKEVFVEKVYDVVDHQFLNNVIPTITTAENIAQWIYNRLVRNLPELSKVIVWETATSGATYYVEGKPIIDKYQQTLASSMIEKEVEA